MAELPQDGKAASWQSGIMTGQGVDGHQGPSLIAARSAGEPTGAKALLQPRGQNPHPEVQPVEARHDSMMQPEGQQRLIISTDDSADSVDASGIAESPFQNGRLKFGGE